MNPNHSTPAVNSHEPPVRSGGRPAPRNPSWFMVGEHGARANAASQAPSSLSQPISASQTHASLPTPTASRMKLTRQRRFLLGAAFSALLAALAPLPSVAADAKPPGKMAFQGFLTDGAGAARGQASPVNLTVTFRIYNSPNAGIGDAIWAESQVVTVDKGHFSVVLGEGTSITGGADLSAHFIGDNANGRYLGITVGSENEISPRIQFLPAPYAHLARYANELLDANGSAVLKSGAGAIGINLVGAPSSELEVGGTIKSTGLAVGGSATVNGTFTVNGSSIINGPNTVNGASTVSGTLSINGNNALQLGAGVGGRQADAGKIAYALFTPNTLDIIGAGTAAGSRAVKVWGEGGTTFTGPVTATTFNGSGAGLTGLAQLGLANTFTGLQNIQNHLRLGELVTGLGTAGWGEALIFSGAPPMTPGFDSDNSDPLWMARFNAGNNSTELRMVIGDDSGASGDRFVIGNMVGSGGFSQSASWSPKFSIDAAGTLEFRPDLTKEASAGRIGYQTFTSDALDIVGAGTAVANRKIKLWAEGGALVNGTLRVNGATAPAVFNLEAVMDPSGPRDIANLPIPLSYGLLVDNRVRAGAFDVVSDLRLKEVQGQSDGAQDLATLKQIAITDFTFKDKVTNGPRPQKKVIAQQVEKVFPTAVLQSSGFVPDIFQKATVEEGWISVAADLKQGDRVRLIGKTTDATHEVVEIAEADPAKGTPRKFRFEPKPTENDIFVYGHEVKDLRSVDYEAIAMLNVSASQELSRRLEKQEKELAELREKLAKALGEKQTLTHNVSAMDARLIRLEEALRQQAALPAAKPEAVISRVGSSSTTVAVAK